MTRYSGQLKEKFLESIPVASIESHEDRLTERSKFNFAYFDVQESGQDFHDWNHDDLVQLLNKLKEYSKEPLSHWKRMPIGKSGSVLAIYGKFPSKSDFKPPKHVPHQAQWGRFRLESAVRLVGFVVPPEYDGKVHSRTGLRFDCNTFYVVFLDAEHRFYKTGEAT